MTALLSAFGTDAVRERHKAWRQSVTDIEEEENTLRWNWEQDGDPEAAIGRRGRVEQRAADGYLKVLSLAEQEAQWLDSIVYNLGLDRKEVEYGVSGMKKVPKPEVIDRATAFALISAFASNAVYTSHTARRAAADALDARMDEISFRMQEDDPTGNVPEEWMKDLTDVLQPKEHVARKALAEAVANELGHR